MTRKRRYEVATDDREYWNPLVSAEAFAS